MLVQNVKIIKNQNGCEKIKNFHKLIEEEMEKMLLDTSAKNESNPGYFISYIKTTYHFLSISNLSITHFVYQTDLVSNNYEKLCFVDNKKNEMKIIAKATELKNGKLEIFYDVEQGST